MKDKNLWIVYVFAILGITIMVVSANINTALKNQQAETPQIIHTKNVCVVIDGKVYGEKLPIAEQFIYLSDDLTSDTI